MKLSLSYDWECSPDAFWELYFDPDFVVRLHLEGLGSLSAEVISQEGDLTTGLVRTLRYSQKPNAPGPVRKIFGEEIVSTEISTFTPATSTTTFSLTPGTMADKTHINGSIALAAEGDGSTEKFDLEARVKIFGVGPIVERFIEHQGREIQEKSVAFMRQEFRPHQLMEGWGWDEPEGGRAPICPFCGVTALPSETAHGVANAEFVCENPGCTACGEVIES